MKIFQNAKREYERGYGRGYDRGHHRVLYRGLYGVLYGALFLHYSKNQLLEQTACGLENSDKRTIMEDT